MVPSIVAIEALVVAILMKFVSASSLVILLGTIISHPGSTILRDDLLALHTLPFIYTM